MNRLIIIGNGFDLAHGLKTKYSDFLDWIKIRIYESIQIVRGGRAIVDDDLCFYIAYGGFKKKLEEFDFCGKPFNDRSRSKEETLHHKNYFLGSLLKNYKNKGWSDIENEYYETLIRLTKNEGAESYIKKLQDDFYIIIKLLEEFLTIENEKTIEKDNNLLGIFKADIELYEIAEEFKTELTLSKFLKVENIKAKQTLFLNFNYTDTTSLYMARTGTKTIHIHGELNKVDNPIIFGYGDELDDDYKNLEKSSYKNVLFNNIKSVNYLKTDNYRQLLTFINSDYYQIYIVGHSCGNTDRTLLNLLFEHHNCASIKPFYLDYGNGKNNYFDLTVNISRNFNNKLKLRDRVVPEPYTEKYYQI